MVTQDVDLWFRDIEAPGVARALKRVGGAYVPPQAGHPPMFAGGAVKLFDIVTHMHGLGDFKREKKHIIKISLGDFKVPVLSLSRIIKSKRATGRRKDKMSLAVLEDVLKVTKKRR